MRVILSLTCYLYLSFITTGCVSRDQKNGMSESKSINLTLEDMKENNEEFIVFDFMLHNSGKDSVLLPVLRNTDVIEAPIIEIEFLSGSEWKPVGYPGEGIQPLEKFIPGDNIRVLVETPLKRSFFRERREMKFKFYDVTSLKYYIYAGKDGSGFEFSHFPSQESTP